MEPTEFWKNFRLGEELSISGTFIYNGLRRYHEMQKLDHADEIFDVLYCLSVGFERLLKIAVVLFEHNDTVDQANLEASLITHSHLDLLARLRRHATVRVTGPQVELLSLLGRFYKSFRYDRFILSSVYNGKKEQRALLGFLGKYLEGSLPGDPSLFGVPNTDRHRRFLHKHATAISTAVYGAVEGRACSLNIYTYELRYGSKACAVFLGGAKIADEDVLWKELLVFFMNTDESSEYIDFLRSIEPLEFDIGRVGEYLDCFRSNAAKSLVTDELEHIYGELGKDAGERLDVMDTVGSPNAFFDMEDFFVSEEE